MAKHSGPRVYFPDTLNEVLHTIRRNPEALVYAGGTYLLGRRAGRFVELPEVMVSLQDVVDLQRTARSDRNIDIGAGVTIAEIVRLGPQNLPRLFHETARAIVPPSVRGLATIGGNLAVDGSLMTSVPALVLLDARVEVRRLGNTRWLPAGQLHSADGSLAVDPGSIISRIRVPLGGWSQSSFYRDGNELLTETDPLTFCALAKTGNGIVEELRIAATVGGPTLIRDKDAEGELAGRRLPVPEREIQSLASNLAREELLLSSLQRYRLTQLAAAFVRSLA